MTNDLADHLTAQQRINEWTQIAEIEYDRATRFFQQRDPFSVYCLHKAVENALYALLLMEGAVVDGEPTLDALIRAASDADESFAPYRQPCRIIEGLNYAVQHPGHVSSSRTPEQILERIDEARRAVRPLLDAVCQRAHRLSDTTTYD